MRLTKPLVPRIVALLVLAVLLAPGTWLRTTVAGRTATAVQIVPLAYLRHEQNGLAVEGLWHLRGSGINFGGYSAMMLYESDGIRLFSDRGFLLTIPRPGAEPGEPRPLATRQLYPSGFLLEDLLDIESVTLDRGTGQYWVGYEGQHVIYRYGLTGEPEAWVRPAYTRDWADNGGIEAMVRLADGRFVVFHEGGTDYYLYPGDPTQGAAPVRGMVTWPAGFSVTDAAELPDGRLVAIVRRVAAHLPPFECQLVLLDPPPVDSGLPWRTIRLASLDALVARDNWEALTVEPKADGTIGLWLATDDNQSILQHSLLARVAFTPPPLEVPTVPAGQ